MSAMKEKEHHKKERGLMGRVPGKVQKVASRQSRQTNYTSLERVKFQVSETES